MAKTTNTKAVFLDVDSSIVEKNLRFTDSNEEEITKIFGAQEFPSKLVKPIPGFCVKTKEASTGCKVFVNVCQTDAIPPPKDISTQQLRDCLNSEDPGDYRVPMSIGEIRTEPDKKGQDSKTCDIAIHPDFFKKSNTTTNSKASFSLSSSRVSKTSMVSFARTRRPY
ncbi:unnamed protein product [Phaedon cochleariae]|uniref:PIH1 N-terminal domain-containing protein n=1 Tax=Phaedon cochleariae TaxID=80249 RepID=A0A9P0GLN7_PHACE|nr:unnamed protein product [Phaedon cochleariae]